MQLVQKLYLCAWEKKWGQRRILLGKN